MVQELGRGLTYTSSCDAHNQPGRWVRRSQFYKIRRLRELEKNICQHQTPGGGKGCKTRSVCLSVCLSRVRALNRTLHCPVQRVRERKPQERRVSLSLIERGSRSVPSALSSQGLNLRDVCITSVCMRVCASCVFDLLKSELFPPLFISELNQKAKLASTQETSTTLQTACTSQSSSN